MNHRILNRARRALRTLTFMVLHHGELRRNRRFHNKHRGERCFILCNGPSVLKQDILPLRNEIVMSVSSGYLHKDFERIRPAYHLVPSVTYGILTEQDFVQWFREMDSKLGDAELFLGSTEYQLVKRHSLFLGRSVNYLLMRGKFRPGETRVVNLVGIVPGVMSVPIMCLVVALYMGFKEIYLLGVDHDSFITREYIYAFEPTIMRGKAEGIDANGRVFCPLFDEFKANYILWGQYRSIKKIAEANGISIFNATAGGMLDEFPRVDLDDVLARHLYPGESSGSQPVRRNY